jgi:hypothetical protein
MTPDAGVKTTLATNAPFGARDPKRGPFFLSVSLYLCLRAFRFLHLDIQLN